MPKLDTVADRGDLRRLLEHLDSSPTPPERRSNALFNERPGLVGSRRAKLVWLARSEPAIMQPSTEDRRPETEAEDAARRAVPEGDVTAVLRGNRLTVRPKRTGAYGAPTV